MKTLASRTVIAQGALLILVAIIHLVMTNEIRGIVAHNTTPKAFAFLWPPYALDHFAVGILLLLIGVTTLLCADGMADVRIRRIALFNGLAVLCLPAAVFAAVPLETLFSAPAFLAATAILIATGVWMLWPVVRRRD
jgi:hypothetical protein